MNILSECCWYQCVIFICFGNRYRLVSLFHSLAQQCNVVLLCRLYVVLSCVFTFTMIWLNYKNNCVNDNFAGRLEYSKHHHLSDILDSGRNI